MCRSIIFIIIIHMTSIVLGGIIQVPQDQPSIQAGINAAVNGDTVLVVDGTYYENINFMGKAIIVASYYIIDGDTTHRDSTIINGSQPANPNAASVVTFESGEDTTSVLYGFTITGGTGSWVSTSSARAGGGIYCYNSGCMIVSNKIINNSTTGPRAVGGGLSALPFGSSAWVVLKGNQIVQNMITANSLDAHGGGLWLRCNAKLTNNLISNNTCIAQSGSSFGEGGGIACMSGAPYSGELVMEHNTITYNSIHSYCISTNPPVAFGAGVAIYRYNGLMDGNEISHNQVWDYTNIGAGAVGVQVGGSTESFLIESNIIRDNAYIQGTGDCYGGGLQVVGPGTIYVINNLIKGNIATYGGGVVVANNIAYPGEAILVNNTIINNTATYGGGIYVHESTAQVMNTIIWGNQAPTGASIDTFNSSIDVAYSDVQGGWTGTENINEDPLLEADSLNNTSPCIGKGIHSYDFGGGMVCYCPPEDMNGRMRPYPAGSNPDMGAWESKEGIVGIEPQRIAGIPQRYRLHQNYPNPFNPTTTIEFSLSYSGFVTLKIFNILGEEVATLVSDRLSSGSFKYSWDATELSSGIYLYRLQAENYAESKKMLLMR